MPIPLIDIFSGPGGLGEGFASLDGGDAFSIVVSAEADEHARETLRLRSFFRRLMQSGADLGRYYEFCSGRADTPYDGKTLSAWHDSGEEARQITLGSTDGDLELEQLLDRRLKRGAECILIGGPPCQAYSLVGRARNRGKSDYRPEDDHRHFLYREYLKVLQSSRPLAFVMENVKGILSSRVAGRLVFHDILLDLVDPDRALTRKPGSRLGRYRIHSLVAPTVFEHGMEIDRIDPREFVIRAEEFGIPQSRHRVILLGVREDIGRAPAKLVRHEWQATVRDAIGNLPPLRSRLSKEEDSDDRWLKNVREHLSGLSSDARRRNMSPLADALEKARNEVEWNLRQVLSRTAEFRNSTSNPSRLAASLSDSNLDAPLNHAARGHMSGDLRRYAFAAVHALVHGASPKGHQDFCLRGLAPEHANWTSGKFADRFRVQVWDRPGTTVTSHISKDGHYFIHPDPLQCRSLTVREAARLQTFPDNYCFMGNRTQQFHQVGNAVPPLLASQIARTVHSLLTVR